MLKDTHTGIFYAIVSNNHLKLQQGNILERVENLVFEPHDVLEKIYLLQIKTNTERIQFKVKLQHCPLSRDSC